MVVTGDPLGIEIFERAAEAGGRLLRVEQLAPTGSVDRGVAHGFAYVLTFDVGRICVAADPATRILSLRQVENPSELSGELIVLDEEDPWWKVSGNEVTRVWPGTEGVGASSGSERVGDLRIQFRKDDENPRIISLRYDDGAVTISEEKKHVG
jgi:hypothetical protein